MLEMNNMMHDESFSDLLEQAEHELVPETRKELAAVK